MIVTRKASRLALMAMALIVLYAISSGIFTERHMPHVRLVPSSVDWSVVPEYYPAGTIRSIPKSSTKSIPSIQAPRRSFQSPGEPDPRREEVLLVFRRGYIAYKDRAWLSDELAPVTGTGKNTLGEWTATLIDTLDTLWIMGETAEFYEAANAAAVIDFSKTSDSATNVFEMTIRHLGGLLSAYELSGEEALLRKAVELGEMLYKAFDTPNRLPGFWLNFDDARKGRQLSGVNDPSASPTSLSLEFTRLSQLTGNPKFYDAVARVTEFLRSVGNSIMLSGMWPLTLDFRNEQAHEKRFFLGALADSLYEYLPKMHLLLGGGEAIWGALQGGNRSSSAQPPLSPHAVGRSRHIISGRGRVF